MDSLDGRCQQDTKSEEVKLYYMKFNTGVWLTDPRLSLCSPLARGVWIDLLCAMHELEQSGELRGTTEELARLARCSTSEFVAALTDIQNKRAGDVIQRNGSWVIANRRMLREAAIRAKRALAGSKGGSKSGANREANPHQNCSYSSSSGCSCLERVREFARGEGIGETDAEWFYWKGEGNGWTNGGEPIRDWKATLTSWKRAGYLPSQRQRNGNGNGQRSIGFGDRKKQKEQLQEQLNSQFKTAMKDDAGRAIFTEEEKTERSRLYNELETL